MPVVIGAQPQSNFTDPIGLLVDCHRRIERFLGVLSEVAAQTRGGKLSDEQRTALATALNYFRDAAPKHTEDEERTLFPRLRRLAGPQISAALARVEELERDHARADKAHAEVERLGRAWLNSGSLSGRESAALSALLADLAGLYREHIAIEEREVFPAAAAALSGAERESAGAEMAARRGLSAAAARPPR